MSYFDKLHCIRWNIGFIEKNICDIYSSGDTFFDVKWVKHDYDYRFFADGEGCTFEVMRDGESFFADLDCRKPFYINEDTGELKELKI